MFYGMETVLVLHQHQYHHSRILHHWEHIFGIGYAVISAAIHVILLFSVFGNGLAVTPTAIHIIIFFCVFGYGLAVTLTPTAIHVILYCVFGNGLSSNTNCYI